MRGYTVGFVMSSDLSEVLLMRKNRPTWQKGLLNGVGGRREFDESYTGCMMREFREETGVETCPEDWRLIGRLYFPEAELAVYASMSQLAFMHARTTTDEELVRVKLSELGDHPVVDNVPALLDLCERSFRSEAASLERVIKHFS